MTLAQSLTDDELDAVLANLRTRAERKRQRETSRVEFWRLYGQWLAATRPFEGAPGPSLLPSTSNRGT